MRIANNRNIKRVAAHQLTLAGEEMSSKVGVVFMENIFVAKYRIVQIKQFSRRFVQDTFDHFFRSSDPVSEMLSFVPGSHFVTFVMQTESLFIIGQKVA